MDTSNIHIVGLYPTDAAQSLLTSPVYNNVFLWRHCKLIYCILDTVQEGATSEKDIERLIMKSHRFS